MHSHTLCSHIAQAFLCVESFEYVCVIFKTTSVAEKSLLSPTPPFFSIPKTYPLRTSCSHCLQLAGCTASSDKISTCLPPFPAPANGVGRPPAGDLQARWTPLLTYLWADAFHSSSSSSYVFILQVTYKYILIKLLQSRFSGRYPFLNPMAGSVFGISVEFRIKSSSFLLAFQLPQGGQFCLLFHLELLDFITSRCVSYSKIWSCMLWIH